MQFQYQQAHSQRQHSSDQTLRRTCGGSSSNIPLVLPPPQYRLGSGEIKQDGSSSSRTSLWNPSLSSAISIPHHHHHSHKHNNVFYDSNNVYRFYYPQQSKKPLSPSDEHHKFALASPAKSSSKNKHQWHQQKPRSWDNLLSTRAFGGYGFGYGFIDTVSSSTKSISYDGRVKSNSTHKLKDNKENLSSSFSTKEKSFDADNWAKDKCSTMPRQRIRNLPKNSDNIVSPLVDTSSCFSCDCLSLDPPPLDMCMFAKPKSTESLLASKSIMPTASETSLDSPENTQRRRSRASSLADCLGGTRHSPPEKDEMTHL